MAAIECEERHEEVTQCNALHHGPHAQMCEAEHVALHGMVEPVDEQSYGEQQHAAPEYLRQHCGAWLEVSLRQRQVARYAHDEEEEGEDEVAWCHAVPL